MENITIIQKTLMQYNYVINEILNTHRDAIHFKVTSIQYGYTFIAKVFPKLAKKENYDNEMNSLTRVAHKNVISLFNRFEDDIYLYLILENCIYGNLLQYLNENGPFNRTEFINISKQLLEAVDACHSIGITHNNIRLDNILIDKHKRPKLADFSKAKIYFNYDSPLITDERAQSTEAEDILALGIVFYQLISGNEPQFVRGEYIFHFPGSLDMELVKLIKEMTDPVPELRYNCNELLCKCFFQQKINNKMRKMYSAPSFSTSKVSSYTNLFCDKSFSFK